MYLRIQIIFLCVGVLFQVSCVQETPRPRDANQPRSQASAVPTDLAKSNSRVESKVLSGEEHWVRGNDLRFQGRYEDAAREYELAIENGFASNMVRTELGILLAHYLRRPGGAVPYFRVAIVRDKGDWRAHWALATVLLDLERYDEALGALESTEGLDPKGKVEGRYAYSRARALDGLGRYDEAVKYYQVALVRELRIDSNSSTVREIKDRIKGIK